MYSRKALALAAGVLLMSTAGCFNDGGGGWGLDDCCDFDEMQARGTLRNADRTAALQQVGLNLDGDDDGVFLSDAAAQIPLEFDYIYFDDQRRHSFSIEIIQQTVPRARYVATDLRVKVVSGSNGTTIREIELPDKTAELAVGDSMRWEFEL